VFHSHVTPNHGNGRRTISKRGRKGARTVPATPVVVDTDESDYSIEDAGERLKKGSRTPYFFEPTPPNTRYVYGGCTCSNKTICNEVFQNRFDVCTTLCASSKEVASVRTLYPGERVKNLEAGLPCKDVVFKIGGFALNGFQFEENWRIPEEPMEASDLSAFLYVIHPGASARDSSVFFGFQRKTTDRESAPPQVFVHCTKMEALYRLFTVKGEAKARNMRSFDFTENGGLSLCLHNWSIRFFSDTISRYISSVMRTESRQKVIRDYPPHGEPFTYCCFDPSLRLEEALPAEVDDEGEQDMVVAECDNNEGEGLVGGATEAEGHVNAGAAVISEGPGNGAPPEEGENPGAVEILVDGGNPDAAGVFGEGQNPGAVEAPVGGGNPDAAGAPAEGDNPDSVEDPVHDGNLDAAGARGNGGNLAVEGGVHVFGDENMLGHSTSNSTPQTTVGVSEYFNIFLNTPTSTPEKGRGALNTGGELSNLFSPGRLGLLMNVATADTSKKDLGVISEPGQKLVPTKGQSERKSNRPRKMSRKG